MKSFNDLLNTNRVIINLTFKTIVSMLDKFRTHIDWMMKNLWMECQKCSKNLDLRFLD